MKKVFDFIENLSQNFIDLLGQPTVVFCSSSIEVHFDSSSKLSSALDFIHSNFK